MGHLARLHLAAGDLAKAEDMAQQSLAMNKAMDRMEGLAEQHLTLGHIFKANKDQNKALKNWKKSQELFEKLGARKRMANVKSLIDEGLLR